MRALSVEYACGCSLQKGKIMKYKGKRIEMVETSKNANHQVIIRLSKNELRVFNRVKCQMGYNHATLFVRNQMMTAVQYLKNNPEAEGEWRLMYRNIVPEKYPQSARHAVFSDTEIEAVKELRDAIAPDEASLPQFIKKQLLMWWNFVGKHRVKMVNLRMFSIKN